MVMMNIAKSAVSSVRALLKKKGLKDAVDVTTKKAKAVSGKAKEAVAKAKPQVDKAVQATKAKVKPVTDKVKPAVEKAKAKVKPAVEKAKETAKAASVKARRKAGPKVRDAAKRVARGAAAATGGALGLAGGLAAAPTLGGAALGATTGFVSAKDPVKGAKIGAGVGGALGLAATGALTASLLKTSTPDEAKYTTKKDAGGSFVTNLGTGKNSNQFVSTKQLAGKDLDTVRRGIAIMDSILLSENPKARQKEFMEIAMFLNMKHGITSIQGRNLNIVMPQGLNEKGNRNLLIRSTQF
tara:strand:+ start:34 stop:924 length:891 start_codon:yes stop_codon:yes gene_type:complete